METISLILPTIARPGLRRTLASIADAEPAPGDELVMVVDGAEHQAAVRAMVDDSGIAGVMRVRVEVLEPAGGCWGQPARNHGLAVARGRWLVFGQDDQCLLRRTLALVRERVAGTRCLHVFRVVPAAGFVVPQDDERRLRLGFVDIDGVVAPRSVARRCRFGLSYAGDYDFVDAVAGSLAAPPAWHGDVVSVNQGWADRMGVTRLE